MASVLFGIKVDMSSVPNPPVGAYIVGYDTLDGKLKQKDSNGVITLIGGGSGLSLSDVLTVGNTTGTSSIVLNNDTHIISGQNKINLSNNIISLTTDNESYSESYLYMISDSVLLANGTKSFRIEPNNIIIKYNDANQQISGNNSYKIVINNQEVLKFGVTSSNNGNKSSVLLSTDGSSISTGVINSAVIGGLGITATLSNSVYVPDLLIQNNKSIKGTIGNGRIRFTSTNGVITSNLSSTIAIMSSTSSVILDSNGILLLDTTVQTTTPNLNTGITYVSSKNSSATASISNSVIIGGQNLRANNSDTVYLGNKVNINNAYTLPSTDGIANQILKTDGLGNITWSSTSTLSHTHPETEITFTNITTGNADLTKHGFMQRYPGGTTLFLRGDGVFSDALSNITINDANGISAVILNPTTSPSITLSLGNITPTTVNNLTITTPTNNATLTITDGNTLIVTNSITLSGIDNSTLDIGSGGILGSAAFTSSSSYAPFSHTHSQTDITGLTASLASKQNTLVSGANIKTVNGNTLLGSGNLVISGGTSFVWIAEHNSTPNTSPVSYTGGSIAIGDGSESYGSDVFTFGSFSGNGATNVTDSVFMGNGAGQQAINSRYSNFIGRNSGYEAFDAENSNFLGQDSGYRASNAFLSNFFGKESGYMATDSNRCNFLGHQAGYQATNSDSSNFIGDGAGHEANRAPNSNFIGTYAGQLALNAGYSNFIGVQAGKGAENATVSNFIGEDAGNSATNADNSNFIGRNSGTNATNAKYSNFLGSFTGFGSTNASYSNLFGFNVGRNPGANNIGANNIIIGTNISLPNATTNAINIGGVLFGIDTYSITTGNPSTLPSNGKIGINVVTPTEALDILGNIKSSGTATISIPTLGSTASTFLTHTGGLVQSRTATQVRSDIGAQATLVSGTNIKTINGNSLLGSGDLVISGGGSGTVTTVSVVSANGFGGTVANASTTPAITLTTSVNGIIKGSANAMTTATAGTDYSVGTSGLATGVLKSTTGTGALSIAVASDITSYPITGYVSGAGTVVATDTILQAIQKLNGNDGLKANLVSPTFTGTVATQHNTFTLPSTDGVSGELAYFGTGTGLTPGAVYYLNSSLVWTLASNVNTTSSLGLLAMARTTNAVDGMLLRGYARFASFPTIANGSIKYLSTGGGITTTQPTSSNNVVRILGYGINNSTKTIYFNPDNSWVEVV